MKNKTLSPSFIRKLLPKRLPFYHKGHCGHVLIVAGSRGMLGSAGLAALGALRSGAGLVTVATPESLEPHLCGKILECLTLPLPETREASLSFDALIPILEFCRRRRVSSLAIGPGLSEHAETVALTRALVVQNPVPAVLDADGLNAFRAPSDLHSKIEILAQSHTPWILTPHPGEMGALLAHQTRQIQKDRPRAVLELARRTRQICVLKGHETLIAYKKELWKNPTGNAGMATGGSGDVLSGMIAAWIGQGSPSDPPFEKALRAALLGVYLHGLAGDLAARELTPYSLTATDIAAAIPKAIQKILK
ncbi:MAG: NAD(P)H-hydrate dehydratase [Elusimicrobia bacterium]|nr:NAD(P)H-hydrate dehydratase [Elusimicrobiota bacterium]